MDILSKLLEPDQWQRYLQYKRTGGRLTRQEDILLERFIEQRRYAPVVHEILDGTPSPHPRRSAISKMHSTKKRIVYTYPPDHNTVLKLMTHLLLRKYDHLFSTHLYSFRAGFSAKDAIGYLAHTKGIGSMWAYKADISDYFNSIPVQRILPMLSDTLSEEPMLYRFLTGLLTDPYVAEGSRLIQEEKGIMAGTPFSTFLADLYLADLDAHFEKAGRIYARYSDDIILFAPDETALQQDIDFIHQYLAEAGLSINPKKEQHFLPGEKWTFLGFSWQDGTIDIAPASVEKLKGKMRRKKRALERWRARKCVDRIHAAKAFIKMFNRKLLEESEDHDLTWARWYFPTITTADSLQMIDHYAQSCIRYLATGKNNKSAYEFRYEEMKKLGYISLVHRYYEGPEKRSAETVDKP